ncbi:site-specific integrase [bacterium]|nr:site-specific integrase [bacterium]
MAKDKRKIHFNKEVVLGLTCPPDKTSGVYFYDREQPNLAIRITPAGGRVFIFSRKIDGKAKRVSLGQFPTMTIAQARGAAASLLARVRAGEDPTATPEPDQTDAGNVSGNMTLGDLWDLYLSRHAQVHKKSWENDVLLYNKHLKAWEGRTLFKITRADLQVLMAKIGKGSGPYAANLVHSLIRTMLYLAQDWGFEQTNPAARLKRFRTHSRSRYLKPEELKRFWTALSDFPDPTFRDFFAVCLLTGQRQGNVRCMAWTEVDLEEGVWTVPFAKAKSGEEMRIVLVPEVVDLLRRRKAKADGPWVFASKRSETGHIEHPQHAWERLCKLAGFEDLRIHDLRRTHGSWAAATGASLAIIGKALGHLDQTATAIYARLDIDPVRQAVMAATGAMMDAVGESRPKAKIEEMPAQAEGGK